MNWPQIESNWAEMKALLKSRWSELREEDLARIDGDRGRLGVALQDRCVLGPEDAERAICAFEKDCRLPGAVK